jgi:secondary thiamine-phosphate synthase enzyme
MTSQQHRLIVPTRGKALVNITSEIERLVRDSGLQTGLCHLFLRHTSASLLIQENADPDVLADLETFLARLIPEDPSHYRHRAEGPDDMPAHIRTALTHTSETIPIYERRLGLGIWQGIYLWEHRDRGSKRELIAHLTS